MNEKEANDEGDRPVLLMVSVEDRYDGEFTLETTDGAEHTEGVAFLEILCLVGDTGSKMPITLGVPVSAGPGLLKALLTDSQFDAVMFADD